MNITNTNFLSPNGYSLSINRLPHVSFFSQMVNIPGITLDRLDQPTSLVKIAIPGDHISFQPLQMQFVVDENMNNYFEVFKWIRGLGHPESHAQYALENKNDNNSFASELQNNYSDAVLIVLGSNNVPVRTFTFVDCFPSSLDISENFSSMNTDVQYVTASLTLEYSYFTVE